MTSITQATQYTSSLSASSTTISTAYDPTFTPSIPKVLDPYIIRYDDYNGTVFIAVGTIIIVSFAILLIARFWFWIKNRKAAKDATDFDDYYGSSPYFDEKDGGFLSYDSSYFGEKKKNLGLYSSSASSFNSTGSSNFNSSSSASVNERFNDLSNLTSQPGRNLRNALTQPYTPPKRNSFISPINQLIQEQYNSTTTINSNNNRLSNSNLLDSTNLTPSTGQLTAESLSSTLDKEQKFKKRNARSISLLFNGDIDNPLLNNKSVENHSRSTSLDLHELEKLIQKSIADVSNSRNESSTTVNSTGSPSSTKTTTTTTRGDSNKRDKRPPSLILDMLVQNEDLNL